MIFQTIVIRNLINLFNKHDTLKLLQHGFMTNRRLAFVLTKLFLYWITKLSTVALFIDFRLFISYVIMKCVSYFGVVYVIPIGQNLHCYMKREIIEKLIYRCKYTARIYICCSVIFNVRTDLDEIF